MGLDNAILSVNPETPLHPYYPTGVVIPGYVSNSLSTPTILTIFSLSCGAILVPSYLVIRRTQPALPADEVAVVLWFVLCGFIHTGLEGYFTTHAHNLGGLTDVLTQAWKEYSLSDSRYLTRDSFIVCMETVTAVFWGPLSLLCAYGIVTDCTWRQPLQSIISLGQLYGTILYYATFTFDDVVFHQSYSRPERYYFWCYYVFLNSFWIWIPTILLVQSSKETRRAFATLKELESLLKKK